MNLIPYMNVPYASRGAFPKSADCWTLARAFLMNEMGFVNVPEYFYDVDSDEMPVSGPLMVKTLADVNNGRWSPVDESELRLGDILVFSYRGQPWHVGVFLGMDAGFGCFLHTRHGIRSTTDRLDDFWKQKFVTARRWTGG